MYWLDWPDCGSLSQTARPRCESAKRHVATQPTLEWVALEQKGKHQILVTFYSLSYSTHHFEHKETQTCDQKATFETSLNPPANAIWVWLMQYIYIISKKQKHFIRKKWWFTRGFFGVSVFFGQPQWFLLGNVVGVEVYGQVRQTGTLDAERICWNSWWWILSGQNHGNVTNKYGAYM